MKGEGPLEQEQQKRTTHPKRTWRFRLNLVKIRLPVGEKDVHFQVSAANTALILTWQVGKCKGLVDVERGTGGTKKGTSGPGES